MKIIKSIKFLRFIVMLLLILSFMGIISSTYVYAMPYIKICAETELDESELNINNDFSDNNNGEKLQNFLKNKTIKIFEYIYNLDDSADYIYVEFNEGGYAIFSNFSFEMMEYSLQGSLPYFNFDNKNYYAGLQIILKKLIINL